MRQLSQRLFHKAVRRAGYDLTPIDQPDFDQPTRDLIRRVHPYTLTSPERIYAQREALRYVTSHGIAGDVVECGVWKGGSMLAAALTLRELDDHDRCLHLFDTFEGMTAPTAKDVNYLNQNASDLMAAESKRFSVNWVVSPLKGVRAVMESSGYDMQKVHFIQGKVEDTLPDFAPQTVALLRLDTDWYESTYHELVHLYPRLSPGGVLIIDDYGHWEGCRRAVDQYFAEHRTPILLNRIDYTGRIAVKPLVE